MTPEEKLEEIKDALHSCTRGEISFLTFALIVGGIVDPVKPTEADFEWAIQKARELGLLGK